jgi:predicted 3-demethylubiquinone-9 3-methyltransferase (glyoxalase superfamily)
VFKQMMQDKDPAKARRYAEAMMKMVKFDIAALQKAFNG